MPTYLLRRVMFQMAKPKAGATPRRRTTAREDGGESTSVAEDADDTSAPAPVVPGAAT